MMLLLLSIATSCSSKRKEAHHDNLSEGVEMSDSTNPEDLEGEDQLALEGGDVEEIQVDDKENQDLMVIDLEEKSAPPSDEVLAEENSPIHTESVAISKDIAEYSVQKGDTLMQIAFKLYGDFGMWKSLKALNPELDGSLKMGSVLKYHVPESKFEWIPQGNPYLVMRGDSLSSISHKVYEKASWWKHIHENNKPMIKDPNQIFTGFTLYYLPKEQIEKKRELASK